MSQAEPQVFLVGEHNPYGSDPRYALYPDPPQSAAGRLLAVLDWSKTKYIRTFSQRRNLLSELPWSVPKARTAAHKILEETEDGDGLVLLGAKVACAFGQQFAIGAGPLVPAVLGVNRGPGLVVASHVLPCLVLPHPSGRSRTWNDPTMAERVRAAVEMFLAVHVPDKWEDLGGES